MKGQLKFSFTASIGNGYVFCTHFPWLFKTVKMVVSKGLAMQMASSMYAEAKFTQVAFIAGRIMTQVSLFCCRNLSTIPIIGIGGKQYMFERWVDFW